MSSPAGIHFSQADFIARWMPSSTRAGVILHPCPGLSGSLRHTSAGEPDDSFASDFAPLPASADSSCLGVDGFSCPPEGAKTGNDGPVKLPRRDSNGELDSLDEMEGESQDLPVMMKLEQLRKWQQHMQEQLKAQQLEELLHLQEEQQRLLGMMNRSQDCTGATGGSREDNNEQTIDNSHYQEHDDTLIPSKGVALTQDNGLAEHKVHDRPINGQKKTFEELLEEQLKLEEQRLKSAHHQQQSQSEAETGHALPKRAFLKRGEGLSRFTHRKASLSKIEEAKDPKPRLQDRVITRSNSEPTAVLRGSKNVQRVPVQRKTATLNKENRQKGVSSPPKDICAERNAARTKVLGSHQRQNTQGSESGPTDPDGIQTKPHQEGDVMEQKHRKVGLSAQATVNANHNILPNPVTKQGRKVSAPKKTDNAAEEKSSGPRLESAEGKTGSAGEVLQDLVELSFQEKLQCWESDQHLESMELGEFELLEQAAEELSFSSNSSFVMKVLKMDRVRAARGLQPRRLSSTPIKSSPRCAIRRCSSLGGSGIEECKGSSMDSDAFVARDDKLKNKVNNEGAEKGRLENSEVFVSAGSDFEGQEVLLKPILLPSTVCFSAQSNQHYDPRSYQDEDSASEVTQSDDAESGSVISNAESTLTEDKDEQKHIVVFDDDDTWNDLEDTAISTLSDGVGVSEATANGSSPPEQTLRMVAVSKAVELDKGTAISSANQEPDPPPASQLMTRLFPSLKPKTQNELHPPPSVVSTAPGPKKLEAEAGQHVQSRLLRERLVELEIEIERFKKENAALTKLRQENEKNKEILRKEHLEFEKMKADWLAKFEEYKKEENRKLQKERKLFEKHSSIARAIPDKKEREEIQVLKQQLSVLQEELRGKESRWGSTHSRLRQQIDTLRQENTALRDEIRVLEKLRLSTWKKTIVSAEKAREVKDSPRTLENNITVTKGVKFASPLDSRGSSNPPQRNSREGGMKSSLRRPAGPGFSSLLPARMEDRTTTASKSQEKLSNQENSHSCSSPKSNSLKEPECSEAEEPESTEEVITHPDEKIEKVFAGGDRLIIFPNGTRKEVSADGLTVKVTFFNGDTKEVTDQRVIYYYAEAQTTHITYPDGMEVLHFPNNQTEKHFPDGHKEITFPDQTVKNLFPDGREESVLTDGTIIQVNPDGTKEIHFNTGQREIHTTEYKQREYPDGTVKTVYNDGRQETRYPTGRLRIKDKDGNVIVDTRV